MSARATNGRFAHAHPGNCKPCAGWGFVLAWYWKLERDAFLRCRDCCGKGWG